MGEFKVEVCRVKKVESHPNADALDIVEMEGKDYQIIIRRGTAHVGDKFAYIPEDALLPLSVLCDLELVDAHGKGKLAGGDGNRVKAIRLRGMVSQGLLYPARSHWTVGMDAKEELGITKWEPEIPSSMAGDVWHAGSSKTLKYDIERVNNYPSVLQEGELVQIAEKCHGSFSLMGIVPESYSHAENGRWIISSKGLSEKGLAFKLNEKNEHNIFIRAANQWQVCQKLEKFFGTDTFVFLLGEVIGAGVQDLTYGFDARKNQIGYRVFDIYVGMAPTGRFLNDQEVDEVLTQLELPRVPILYRGPFSKEVMLQHTKGKETISGKELHIREGVVIKPQIERRDPTLGRVILKSISQDYLVRKGGTEYH